MDKKEIQKLYRKYSTPKHIILHMKKVAHVADNLIKRLKLKGFKIDQKLIQNAALLHDVVRYVDFQNIEEKNDLAIWKKLRKKYHKIGHEKAMAKILKESGETKLANLVAKHGFFSVDKLKSLEEKILYYADKRVDKDKIVDLKTRFKEGKKRNRSPNENPKLIQETEKKVISLESEIANLLGESID